MLAREPAVAIGCHNDRKTEAFVEPSRKYRLIDLRVYTCQGLEIRDLPCTLEQSLLLAQFVFGQERMAITRIHMISLIATHRFGYLSY